MLKAKIEFLKEVEKLKTVTRWNRTLDKRDENSAEHSWNVALMALVLVDHAATPIDLLKVVKMLLIHDLVEIDVGDISIFDEGDHDKERREEIAARRIFGILPNELAGEFLGHWLEFEARQSSEARFASVIDGLQPLLNHLQTGHLDGEVVPEEVVRQKKKYIQEFAPELWGVVEQLIEESTAKGYYC